SKSQTPNPKPQIPTANPNRNPSPKSQHLGFGIWDFLERGPEAELCGPRLERNVRVVLRLAIVCCRFVGDKCVVVRMVEHVEHLGDPVELHAAAEPETLLDAQVHPMQIGTVEAVARDERSVAP